MSCFLTFFECHAFLRFLSVMFSLVCESKAGFSMRQLIKRNKCCLTCAGFISTPPLGICKSAINKVEQVLLDLCGLYLKNLFFINLN